MPMTPVPQLRSEDAPPQLAFKPGTGRVQGPDVPSCTTCKWGTDYLMMADRSECDGAN